MFHMNEDKHLKINCIDKIKNNIPLFYSQEYIGVNFSLYQFVIYLFNSYYTSFMIYTIKIASVRPKSCE